MFKEQLLSIPHLKSDVNPIVKAYIMSEALLWSGWYLVIPITALFVIADIPGGNIQFAATGFSIYLVTRVVFELISGQYLAQTTDKKKLAAAATGVLLTSLALSSFAFSDSVTSLFISYAIGGMGLGIGAPAKNALFSIHIDKNKETTEWSIADGITFICMALATALGGFIAAQYGFKIVFLLAGAITLLGFIPYFLVLSNTKK